MRSRSIPASARHSANASTIRSSGPLCQRSPKREQPMPTIATLSLMPRAMSGPHRCGLPEIAPEASHQVEILDAEHEANGCADRELAGRRVRELREDVAAVVDRD